MTNSIIANADNPNAVQCYVNDTKVDGIPWDTCNNCGKFKVNGTNVDVQTEDEKVPNFADFQECQVI